MFTLLFVLAAVFVKADLPDSDDGGTLTMQLLGSEVDEGNYKQTALLNFEAFDDKCRLRRVGSVKLNKKTKTATRPFEVDKPVIVQCFYTDQRTQYGRSVNQKIVFYPDSAKDYILAIQVEGDKVGIHVFEMREGESRGAEVAVQRGYVEVKCE